MRKDVRGDCICIFLTVTKKLMLNQLKILIFEFYLTEKNLALNRKS